MIDDNVPVPAMAQTNSMLADGGVMQEGGTVDPVSGNDVPIGSLKEEVRDDIDAKLSEGEFVIPADVVRYIGLEKLMKIRDAAKEGLKRMEEVGQMGNAEEAPKADEAFEEDDDEFDSSIDEIMSEVDNEETTKMAVGGYITGTDIGRAPKNPVVDVRYFKHADGRMMYITHINGKPMTAVPEGFTATDKPVEQKVGKVAEETAAVNGAGGGDSGGGMPTGESTSATTGPGQGVSTSAQSAALSALALSQSPIAQIAVPGVAALAGYLGGKVADQQLDAMGRAQDAMSVDSTMGGQLGTRSDESGNISSFSNQSLTDAFDQSVFGTTSAEMDAARGLNDSSYGTGIGAPGESTGPTSSESGAGNPGESAGPTSSESGAGNPGESAASESASDYGGTGGSMWAKGGFISKKTKSTTKAKKGLASR